VKTLVIMGSSRSDGDTMRVVKTVLGDASAEIIKLNEKKISPYDYAHKNTEDDFQDIAQKMVEADNIIFATPVYWYSMSAQLKAFFDRFTDLITIRKDLGRKLKGKKCYVISCGSDVKLPPGFENPFSATCAYLDMEYKGCFYYYTGKADNDFKKTALKKASEEATNFGRIIFG